jgi:hypothetical protein
MVDMLGLAWLWLREDTRMYIYRVLTNIGRLQWGVYGLGPKMGPLADLMSPVILGPV